jgi:hypothetical protein
VLVAGGVADGSEDFVSNTRRPSGEVLSCALLLLIGLYRMAKSGWLKFSVRLLPAPAITFEVSAVPKPREPPDGVETPAASG